jgi:hypothetical protein
MPDQRPKPRFTRGDAQGNGRADDNDLGPNGFVQ